MELNQATGLQINNGFSAFDPVEWSRLIRGDFVFADLRFYKALEDSGSIGERTGWLPAILSHRINGQLEGVLPLFVKDNSYGEYIFDWAWAEASERAGLPYYPKLVSAVPFTPATGPKFLMSASGSREPLIQAAKSLGNDLQTSSTHLLFTTDDESQDLEAQGFLTRHSFQYHWKNRDWASFKDFLASLRSKRRAEIGRERDAVSKSEIRIARLTGDDIKPEHARLMKEFYHSTLAKMGGYAYLSDEFFDAIVASMSDAIVFFVAYDGNRPVAGALNFREPKGKTLFGRYWGCRDEYRNLHFELCYYSAIDYCLSEKIELFEAGAQGEHKFNRGFLPNLTYSQHDFRDPQLRSAVAPFLKREKLALERLFREYEESSPYKRTSGTNE